MNIEELILTHYKSREFISKHELFIENPALITDLLKVVQSDLKYPFPAYASWWLFHIARSKAKLLESYQTVLIDCVLTNENGSVLRNTMGALLELQLIEYREGELLDRLFHLLITEDYKVAIHVYSLYLLIDFTKKYPEIKQEIIEIIRLKESKPHTPALTMGIKNYLKATKSF
jgi:hypothetical protein